MKFLGYIILIIGLLVGGTTVTPFSFGKYRQKSSWNRHNWYWKLLVFFAAIAICILGVSLIG